MLFSFFFKEVEKIKCKLLHNNSVLACFLKQTEKNKFKIFYLVNQ